jgi:hypothetical protein
MKIMGRLTDQQKEKLQAYKTALQALLEENSSAVSAADSSLESNEIDYINTILDDFSTAAKKNKVHSAIRNLFEVQPHVTAVTAATPAAVKEGGDGAAESAATTAVAAKQGGAGASGAGAASTAKAFVGGGAGQAATVTTDIASELRMGFMSAKRTFIQGLLPLITSGVDLYSQGNEATKHLLNKNKSAGALNALMNQTLLILNQRIALQNYVAPKAESAAEASAAGASAAAAAMPAGKNLPDETSNRDAFNTMKISMVAQCNAYLHPGAWSRNPGADKAAAVEKLKASIERAVSHVALAELLLTSRRDFLTMVYASDKHDGGKCLTLFNALCEGSLAMTNPTHGASLDDESKAAAGASAAAAAPAPAASLPTAAASAASSPTAGAGGSFESLEALQAAHARNAEQESTARRHVTDLSGARAASTARLAEAQAEFNEAQAALGEAAGDDRAAEEALAQAAGELERLVAASAALAARIEEQQREAADRESASADAAGEAGSAAAPAAAPAAGGDVAREAAVAAAPAPEAAPEAAPALGGDDAGKAADAAGLAPAPAAAPAAGGDVAREAAVAAAPAPAPAAASAPAVNPVVTAGAHDGGVEAGGGSPLADAAGAAGGSPRRRSGSGLSPAALLASRGVIAGVAAATTAAAESAASAAVVEKDESDNLSVHSVG